MSRSEDRKFFQDLSLRLENYIDKRQTRKINSELCKLAKMLKSMIHNNVSYERWLNYLMLDVPNFLLTFARILHYKVTPELLDSFVGVCYFLKTLQKIRVLVSDVLKKVLRGVKPWHIIVTLQEPSITRKFLLILHCYLQQEKELQQNSPFTERVRLSGILPFLIQAKFVHVDTIDVFYSVNSKSPFTKIEVMENVLRAMWGVWYESYRSISFGWGGNCVVDGNIRIRDTGEKTPRYVRRIWFLFWSKEARDDFKSRFNAHKRKFYTYVNEFVLDVERHDWKKLMGREFCESKCINGVLKGIDADWVVDHKDPKRLWRDVHKIRDVLHSRLLIARGEVDDAILSTRMTDIDTLRKELLSGKWTRKFHAIHKSYFSQESANTSMTIKRLWEDVKKISSKLKRLRQAIEADESSRHWVTKISEFLDTAAQWRIHLEKKHADIIESSRDLLDSKSYPRGLDSKSDPVRVYFLEFDPKDTTYESLCFTREKKALCDIFNNKHVEFTSSNFSWYSLVEAWKADILYISGHSFEEFKGKFDFETDWCGQCVRRDSERVSNCLLGLPVTPPKVLVLSQCHSESLGDWFRKVAKVPFVIVSKRQTLLNDSDAFNFLQGFFQELVKNKKIPHAFKCGKWFLMGKTRKEEDCCCTSHVKHECDFCEKHNRQSCCQGTRCKKKVKKNDDCSCTGWIKKNSCCLPSCTLDPKDRLQILYDRKHEGDNIKFEDGVLEILPTDHIPTNIYPSDTIFQRQTSGQRCTIGDILILLKNCNKVIVVHSNGEPGLGKKSTVLAVCRHLQRNYLGPKPFWKRGIWKIEKIEIESFLNQATEEKASEVNSLIKKPGYNFLEWLDNWYTTRIAEPLEIKKTRSNSNTPWNLAEMLFLLYAPNEDSLVHQLFRELRAAENLLPRYMQFIVVCRKPSEENSFPSVVVEPLSYEDGTRLFRKKLRQRHIFPIPPPKFKHHKEHLRRLLVGKVKGCCTRKQRCFECTNNHITCESCWAEWELTHLFPDDHRNMRPAPRSCCPTNRIDTKDELFLACPKCIDLKYHIFFNDDDDVCEDSWIQQNFYMSDMPCALAHRLWRWDNTPRLGWLNESVKYFSCLFLRGNPQLICTAVELLHTNLGGFKVTINVLIDLVYTFIDNPNKIEEYLCGKEMVWVEDRGCFPKKLSIKVDPHKRKTVASFLKLLYQVQLPSNFIWRKDLREFKIIPK